MKLTMENALDGFDFVGSAASRLAVPVPVRNESRMQSPYISQISDGL